ncbi:prenyltransferase [Vulcanisaeta thermophila]|uniref:prenyltransferase n=1 Tax=Vulcanisaeta thermophila TaxID=867917 RepID=UPI00085322FB|nr:prenyltransferase [Vulcanisaeta thermophila]
MTTRGLRPWLLSTSPTTLTSAFSSVTLGTALAWYLNGVFNPLVYLVTVLGVMIAQAGVNLVHDYVDYKTGVDILYRKSGFSHRPHPIIDLGLNPVSVRRVGYALLITALALGIYLTLMVGWAVIALALAGLLIGVGYSEWPLRFHYRGFGEVLAGLAMGPLVTWGSYIVQTGIFTNWAPLLVGVPNGAFTFLILIGSGALEVDACRAVGKLTVVLLVGIERVKYVVYATIALIYTAIVLSVILHFLPYTSLVSLLLIPSTIRLAGPLLSGDESVVRQRWRELRKLWAGPFSIRLLLLIILIASMVISRLLHVP